MGKILETTYKNTVENITSFYSDLINNSFYTLNDKKPTIVTYYNINKDYTSLDPGSKLSYDNIGENSSIRFNKINDFIIYGFNRIELQSENDEYGLENEKITGDCIVLPNTIIPTEGDYFEVDHIKDSTWLFIVTDVQRDTLSNGSNVYKLTYRLEYVDHDKIQQQVVENFSMIEKREGTNIVKIVQNENLNTAREMDKIAVTLKDYFNELFYNEKVQTFTYSDLTEWRIYDPYMIEFLIRNHILDNGSDSYVYVTHQIDTEKTFSMDYDKTFFRAFEEKSIEKLIKSKHNIIPEEIKSFGTTFSSRYETYFKAKYIDAVNIRNYATTTLPSDIIYKIQDKDLILDDNESDLWINIFIKYFYNEDYTKEEINSVFNIRFEKYDAFYIIPLLILCLEYNIEKALK